MITRGLFVTFLLLSGPATLRAQENGSVEQATAVLHDYLNADCEVGAEGASRNALLAHAETLEPQLTRILMYGPEDGLRTEHRQILEAEWDRREAFLATDPALGLSPEHLLAVHSTGRDEYLQEGSARFEQACRERAVLGLATIGSPAAIQALGQAANVLGEELEGLIRAALETKAADREERTLEFHERRSAPARSAR